MRSQNNYRKSNAIRCVDFQVSSESKLLAARLLDGSAETGHRQILSQNLADSLCDDAGIDIVNRVKISDARQYHKKRAGRTVLKQYGYYKPDTRYLYINNRTAVRGQLLASKTFLNTLLHEWMHHYDSIQLGLNSIHTSGFYNRLQELEKALGIRI